MADVTVDARGLQCPMPVTKTSQAMDGIMAGQTLELLATDRGSLSDIPAWAKDMGHELDGQDEVDGAFRFLIRKC